MGGGGVPGKNTGAGVQTLPELKTKHTLFLQHKPEAVEQKSGETTRDGMVHYILP